MRKTVLFLVAALCSVVPLRADPFVPGVGAGTSMEREGVRFAFDKRFENSTKSELAEKILAESVSLDEWLTGLQAFGVEFLCLGETHDDTFRERMAAQIFSGLGLDTLYLEATAGEVGPLLEKIDAAGGEPVDHLGADMAGVVRASRARNPGLRIVGIEETHEQDVARRDRPEYGRDSSIAENIAGDFKPGERHAALYGALHCARNSISLGFQRPFYRHMLGVIDETKRVNALVVMDGDWSDKLSIYIGMLELNGRSFVIPDTSRIDPAAYNFLWDLRRHFDNYEAIVFLK